MRTQYLMSPYKSIFEMWRGSMSQCQSLLPLHIVFLSFLLYLAAISHILTGQARVLTGRKRLQPRHRKHNRGSNWSIVCLRVNWAKPIGDIEK